MRIAPVAWLVLLFAGLLTSSPAEAGHNRPQRFPGPEESGNDAQTGAEGPPSKATWVGSSSGQATIFDQCVRMSGVYVKMGSKKSRSGVTYYPGEHSPAIEEACRGFTSSADIACLLRIRREQRISGEAARFHGSKPHRGAGMRFEQLDTAQVRACARTHG